MSIRAAIAVLLASGAPEVVDAPHWSATDKDAAVTVSPDGRTAYRSATGNGHALVRAVQGRSSGKFYVEFATPVERGNVPGGGITAGIVRADYPLSSSPGEAANGFGVQYRRWLSDSDSIWTYQNAATGGDSGVTAIPWAGWLGVAVDIDNQRIWWIADGVWAGGKNPKSHPTNPWTASLGVGTFHAGQSCYYTHTSYPTLEGMLRVSASEMNMGVDAFQPGGVLEGFLPWDGAAIPDPVPVTPADDPDADKRKLILTFDAAGSPDFTDSSPAGRTVTNNGGVTQRYGIRKWGQSSAYFRGYSQSLGMADSDDWDIGAGEFGIEGWFYFVDDPASWGGDPGMYFISQGIAPVSSRSFGLGLFGASLASCTMQFEILSGSARHQCIATGVNITKGAWHYIAATRQGNTLRLGLDGVQIATQDVTGVTANASDRPLLVGAFEDATYQYAMRGFIDMLRFTKGVSVSVDVVPTLPFA